jgi:site-specific DNA-methyltransferase (adenine-specific)
MNNIIQGDCLEVMKTLPENSVDSIVTDPPYELGFMGKSWDSTGIANNKEMWAEALRVLKPGGHLLSFGGTRTYHRMACAIEDAGFEVRDMVSWIYGSGFPKSLNIGKAVDKLQGNEREYVKTIKKLAMSGDDINSHEGWSRPSHRNPDGTAKRTLDITKGTSPYEGWGTALKPACEPCVLARKPLSEKTVALNVLKWGTGGINIDGSRVGTEQIEQGRDGREAPQFSGTYNNGEIYEGRDAKGGTVTGRFPANIIHDGSDEVVSLFPNTKGEIHNKPASGIFGNEASGGKRANSIKDSGSASRFFYCAKTSKSERNKGCEELEEVVAGGMAGRADGSLEGNIVMNRNNHPTVKPQALMKYLINLITPKGGTVLDPFAGSGSTLVAAKDLGFNYIGIEREEDYIKIINARLK